VDEFDPSILLALIVENKFLVDVRTIKCPRGRLSPRFSMIKEMATIERIIHADYSCTALNLNTRN